MKWTCWGSNMPFLDIPVWSHLDIECIFSNHSWRSTHCYNFRRFFGVSVPSTTIFARLGTWSKRLHFLSSEPRMAGGADPKQPAGFKEHRVDGAVRKVRRWKGTESATVTLGLDKGLQMYLWSSAESWSLPLSHLWFDCDIDKTALWLKVLHLEKQMAYRNCNLCSTNQGHSKREISNSDGEEKDRSCAHQQQAAIELLLAILLLFVFILLRVMLFMSLCSKISLRSRNMWFYLGPNPDNIKCMYI